MTTFKSSCLLKLQLWKRTVNNGQSSPRNGVLTSAAFRRVLSLVFPEAPADSDGGVQTLASVSMLLGTGAA